MREERIRQALRMQLLALVLALALTWYALNPAPGPAWTDRPDAEPPDENRREARNAFGAHRHPAWSEFGVGRLPVSPPSRAEEAWELEWPEVIDIEED